MHISQRADAMMVNRITNNVRTSTVRTFPKRYPVDLGEGRIVFLETPMTAEEYCEAERKSTQARIEASRSARQVRIWAGTKPVGKPIFDRKSLMPSKLDMMIKAEMQKVGL